MSVDLIVPVVISVSGAKPSRPSFGIPLLCGYHTAWTDRVRSYARPGDMLDDGFTTNDALYKMAVKLKSQNPCPPTFKVGRRANVFTQALELTPVSTEVGFVYAFTVTDLEGDEIEVSYTVVTSDTVALIIDALFAQLEPVAATVLSANSETFNLDNNMTLLVKVDGVPYTVTFITGDFVNIDAATAEEVVTAINQSVVNGGVGFTLATGTTTVRLTSPTLGGPRSTIQVTGGTANAILGFPTTKDTGEGVEGLDATDNTTKLSLTTVDDGVLFDFDFGALDPLSELKRLDVTADPDVAEDLAAILAADPIGWYAFGLDSNSPAEVEAAAAWVQAEEKTFFANLSDWDIVSSSVDDDIGSELQAASYTHMVWLYSQRVLLSWSGVALMGAHLPTDPGTSTLAFKTLAGVLVDPLSENAKAQILAKGGSYYAEEGGIGVVFEGLTPGGEYYDTVRFVHYLKAQIQLDVFAALAANPKIPYTDTGVSIITGIIGARLQANVETEEVPRGLAKDPAPFVTAPRVKDVLSADKVSRTLNDVRFSGTLSGAIHRVSIAGEIAP